MKTKKKQITQMVTPKIKLGRPRMNMQNILLAVIAIFIVALNVLLNTVSWHLDLSKGQAYTLSASSRKMMHGLKNNLSLTLFMSPEVPAKLKPIQRDVIDLLKEYKNQNPSKISFATVNPKKDDKAASDAQSYGVTEVQFSQQDQDNFAVSGGYFGLGVKYGDKKEAIPVLSSPENLEFNLTSIIFKLTNDKPSDIGLIGSDDVDTQQLQTLNMLLDKQFQVTRLATPEAKYKTLLVFDSVKKEYNADEIALLQKYLEGGGKALFFVDGIWIQQGGSSTGPAKHNLFDLLKKWGIEVEKDLLTSQQAEVVNIGGGQSPFPVQIRYPYWFVVSDFGKSGMFSSNIQAISFPWGASLKSVQQNGITYTPLAYTTKETWKASSGASLTPGNIPPGIKKDYKQFVVGAMTQAKNGAKVVVIPSSRFIQDQFVSPRVNNFEYVSNVLADLATDGALSGITQRTVDVYPLPAISDSEKDMFKYLNILLLPGLFVAYGVYRLSKRKQRTVV